MISCVTLDVGMNTFAGQFAAVLLGFFDFINYFSNFLTCRQYVHVQVLYVKAVIDVMLALV